MTTIWHNPRCSKSRQTLALIEDKSPVTVRKYLEDAPNEAEIRDVLAMLDVSALQMMRKGEAEFKARGLGKDSSEDELIAAMVAVPKLIERPIVIANGQARIGRPPESVLDIL